MKQHRKLTFGLILVMMIAIAPLAMAGQHGGKGHRGKGFGKMMGLGMLKAANLTSDQKENAVAIIKGHMDDIKAKMDSVAEARENMANAMHADNATADTVRTAHEAVADAQTEVAVLRFTIMQEIKGILTEEQLAALKAKRTRRIERMKQKYEKRWSQFEERLNEFAAQ